MCRHCTTSAGSPWNPSPVLAGGSVCHPALAASCVPPAEKSSLGKPDLGAVGGSAVPCQWVYAQHDSGGSNPGLSSIPEATAFWMHFLHYHWLLHE